MATRRRSASKSVKKSDQITEEDVNAAVAIIQRDYYQDVASIGEELIRLVKDGQISNDEQLEERLQQEVDGSARVIYTFQSKLGLLVCKNDEAYEDEFGEKPADVAVQMAYAMIQDVREYIDGSIEF